MNLIINKFDEQNKTDILQKYLDYMIKIDFRETEIFYHLIAYDDNEDIFLDAIKHELRLLDERRISKFTHNFIFCEKQYNLCTDYFYHIYNFYCWLSNCNNSEFIDNMLSCLNNA